MHLDTAWITDVRFAPYLDEMDGDHQRAVATRGRVVAGLSFGFWRALFDRKNSALWVSQLHRAFPTGSGDCAAVAALRERP